MVKDLTEWHSARRRGHREGCIIPLAPLSLLAFSVDKSI